MKIEVKGVFEVKDSEWGFGDPEVDTWFIERVMPTATLILHDSVEAGDHIGVLNNFEYKIINERNGNVFTKKL
jgi:hypothetical protein